MSARLGKQKIKDFFEVAKLPLFAITIFALLLTAPIIAIRENNIFHHKAPVKSEILGVVLDIVPHSSKTSKIVTSNANVIVFGYPSYKTGGILTVGKTSYYK